MTTTYCIGTKTDGSFCEKRAKANGYCLDHDPAKKRDLEKEQKQQQREEAARESARKAKYDQRREIFEKDLNEMVLECNDLESLRRLELKIMKALIDGTIDDPRIGSPVVQLLKHQADLIEMVKPDDGLKNAGQREIAIMIAMKMPAEQQLQLLGDFAQGMKLIEKQAKTEAIEVSYKLIEEERK